MSTTFGQREDELKPITEYRVISDLATVGKDKSTNRDWNVKLKDAMEQIYKNTKFIEIMKFLEDTSITSTGSTVEEVIEQAEQEFVFVDKSEWTKLGSHLKIILLQKCEE